MSKWLKTDVGWPRVILVKPVGTVRPERQCRNSNILYCNFKSFTACSSFRIHLFTRYLARYSLFFSHDVPCYRAPDISILDVLPRKSIAVRDYESQGTGGDFVQVPRCDFAGSGILLGGVVSAFAPEVVGISGIFLSSTVLPRHQVRPRPRPQLRHRQQRERAIQKAWQRVLAAIRQNQLLLYSSISQMAHDQGISIDIPLFFLWVFDCWYYNVCPARSVVRTNLTHAGGRNFKGA